MNIPTKVLLGGASLGTLGGAGFAANYFLSDNSIGRSLKDKGHILLSYDTNANDSSVWNPIVKAYASSSTKFEGVEISIQGNSNTTPTKNNINALKEACEKFVATNKDNEKNLKIAEQFCVTPITVKALAEKNKRTILDSDVGNENDSGKWDSIVEKYIQNSGQNGFSSVTITSSDPANEKEKRNRLRGACKTSGEKLTHAQDFHTEYAKFQEWCTIPASK